MPITDYLNSTLKQLEGQLQELEPSLPIPNWVKAGGGMHFRHSEHSDVLFVYLKGVKLISTLNAAVLLLQHGYTQEVGALCRMADDYCYEVMFMLKPLGEHGASKDQVRMLDSFFQEEFENPDNPLAPSKGRDTVGRQKIHAAFGKIVSDELNPSDAQNVLTTIHQTFSGYVHGAYPHVMEMYGGKPPRFHMAGMLNTPRIPEWERQMVEHVYRAIMCMELVSRKLASTEVEKAIRGLLVQYEDALDCKAKESAEAMIRREKKK